MTYLVNLSSCFYCVIRDLCKYTAIKHQHYPFCLADNNAPGPKSVKPVTHPTLSPELNHKNSNLSFFAAADGLLLMETSSCWFVTDPRESTQKFDSVSIVSCLWNLVKGLHRCIILWISRVGHGFVRSFLRCSEFWSENKHTGEVCSLTSN